MEKMTQCEKILRHLDDFGSITSRDAINEYSIYRLASRICDLKKQGVPIETETICKKNIYGETVRFARYSLGGAANGETNV